MTFSSPLERVEGSRVPGEREALTAMLDFQRATSLEKMNGLSDAAMRRAVAPSGLTLLGLVKHLAFVEHWWFVQQYAGEDAGYLFEWTEDDPDGDFRVEPDETTDFIVQAFVGACERSRTLAAAAASWDEQVRTPERGTLNMRWVMLHMIEEYARHNGHADLIRELIDGTTGI